MLLYKKIGLAALALSLSGVSFGQSEDSAITMPVFTVQGVRHDVDVKQSPKHITVITQEEIKNAPVQNVAELLEYAVNIDVKTRGYFGMQADISLRGSAFNQVLIMVDGVKMSDVQTGHHNFNIPVPMHQIESIQVVNSGASRLYGPYAFAGAINIITKSTYDDEVQLGVSVGEYGLHTEQVAVSKQGKNLSGIVSYQRMSGTGYIKNTDFLGEKLYTQLRHSKGKFTTTFQGGYNHNAFGAQNFYTANFPSQFDETRTFFGALKTEYVNGNHSLALKINGRRNYDRFELYREGPGWYQRTEGYFVNGNDTALGWYNDHNYHFTDIFSADVNYRLSSRFGKTSVGLEARTEQIYSSLLGDSVSEPIAVSNYPAYYARSAKRNNLSIFVDHGIYKDRWSVSAGALINANSDYGTYAYPGVEAAVWPWKTVKVSSSYGRSVRFPTYTELDYNRGGAIGSRNLKPEVADNVDLSIKHYSKKGFVLGATAFVRDGKNLIDWVRYDGSAITQAANLTQVTFTGVDFDARWNPRKVLGKKFFVKHVGVNYMLLDANRNSAGFTSAYVLDFLSYKFHATVTHESVWGIDWQWRFTMQDRRGGFFDPNAGVNVDYKPYNLLDLRLQKVWKEKVLVYIEGSNLLNVTYYDIGNVQLPGRWIRGGIVVSLGY